MTTPARDDRLQPWLRFKLAQGLTLLGKDASAVDVLASLAAETPGYVQAWRHLGFLHAKHGRDAAAAEALARAVAIVPGDAATRFNLGFVLHRLGRTDEAIAEYRRVIEATPNNDRAWYGLGVCLCEQGKWAEAVEPLREAAKQQYFNPHAGMQLALAYHRLGRRDDLKAEYERVKSFEPKFAEQIRRETGLDA